ncbi:hypothetical protein ACIGXM_22680 [Kitasatospora sp. NPDC052896]|uniref:hypothetical protein n=1 Tax=Kitasatospora sp. NPDC052896 TaxID=3364061 RepID=UPI0037C50752
MLESPVRQDADAAAVPHVLGFEEVGARAVLVKCMGRTYSAAAAAERVTFSDVTDITRPLCLGAAVRAGDALWDVRTPDGRVLLRTGDLLPAVVALREDYTSSTKTTGSCRGAGSAATPPQRTRAPGR